MVDKFKIWCDGKKESEIGKEDYDWYYKLAVKLSEKIVKKENLKEKYKGKLIIQGIPIEDFDKETIINYCYIKQNHLEKF